MNSGYDAIATEGGPPGYRCVGAPTKGELHAALKATEGRTVYIIVKAAAVQISPRCKAGRGPSGGS